MATAAGDGTATAGTSNGYEGGGVGGKFRKRPLRKNQPTTPYDRPPTALRNPSWITKLLVDPAAKFITSSAQRFFPSFYAKRLTAPPTPLPPPPGPSLGSQDLPQESGPGQGSKHLAQGSRPNDYAGALVVAGQEGGNAACSSGKDSFSELEQLLKLKTFTRAEIDRLTGLLNSKAVDMPIANEEKKSEAAPSRPALDFSCSLPKENRRATPVTNPRILEDEIASPAELAKAFMGSKTSEVSPSMLSMRSQAVREDTPLLKNALYVQTSPIPSVTTRTPGLLGVRENGFSTPRSRGRSAIYNMARTPYSRVRQTDVQKASSSIDYVFGGMPSSQLVSEHDGRFGSNQTLKRRSYVLDDDDLGSVGPMRRIRQKPSLRGVSRLSAGVALAGIPHREVAEVVADDQDNKTTPKRHVAVPPKSSETAAKILEHLDKMTPKGKSSESKLAAGNERTPFKLSLNLLHGRDFRGLEDLDSPKLLQNAQDSSKLDYWSKIHPPNPHELKQREIEQNGHKGSVSESTAITKNDSIFSFKDAQASVGTNFLGDKSSDQHLQKKRAFKMNAHEDSFELEQDRSYTGLLCQLANGREKLEISNADEKSVSSAEPMSKLAPALEVRAPLGALDKKTDRETPDFGAITTDNATFLPSASSVSLNINQSAPVFNKSKETTVDKFPSFLFSSSTPFAASNSSSVSNLSSSPTEAWPNHFEAGNLQKAVDINGKVEALPFSQSSVSTSAFFSFGASSSSSSLSNGLPAPSPVISATSSLESNFTKDVSTSSSNVVAPLVPSTIGTTTCGLFSSGAMSSVSEEPLVKGSSGVPPASVSALSTTSAEDVKAKVEIGTTFGNWKGSPFPGGESLVGAQTCVAVPGTSAISGSIPVLTCSSASSPSPGDFPFGSTLGATGHASASPFGASSSAGSSTGASNGTTPAVFTFGATSSAPASETGIPASPGIFSFQNSSSASSTNAAMISSSTTPSIFNFGGNPSSSSTNVLNTATPGIFGFSASSSASPTNAVDTPTSALAPGIFSFGASSSASSTNASTTVSRSPFTFGASLASSQTSSAAEIFGSTGQPPQSPPGFSSPFSSSTPSGFPFGASSSPFATPSTTPVVFGSTPPNTSTGSAILFGSTNSASQPMFGNSASALSGNNDNMEDSMAEDPVQVSSISAVSFGQPSVSASSGGFVFGSTSPSTPFQFSGQQSQATQISPFAASGSLEIGGGGSFSLGSTGPDKSGRKIVKVNRNKHRKK